jgi:hypothetical protein
MLYLQFGGKLELVTLFRSKKQPQNPQMASIEVLSELVPQQQH